MRSTHRTPRQAGRTGRRGTTVRTDLIRRHELLKSTTPATTRVF